MYCHIVYCQVEYIYVEVIDMYCTNILRSLTCQSYDTHIAHSLRWGILAFIVLKLLSV